MPESEIPVPLRKVPENVRDTVFLLSGQVHNAAIEVIGGLENRGQVNLLVGGRQVTVQSDQPGHIAVNVIGPNPVQTFKSPAEAAAFISQQIGSGTNPAQAA